MSPDLAQPALGDRLADAVTLIDAPDVVVAVTRHGRRTVMTGGSALTPPTPRHALRYELGSLSKTFTVLLLADLARAGALSLDDRLAVHLPEVPPAHPQSRRITLRHLATHTSGLPRIPADLIPGALVKPYDNGYARYDTERLLHAFARTRPRNRPGTRWRYSNFGLALLGPAMSHAAGAGYATLLADRVLRPLGLTGTTLGPGTTGTDAIGHRANGVTPVRSTEMGAFVAAGSVRATPGDLLTYLEALLSPDGTPLAGALRDVQVPLLRRGWRKRHTHTLTWYQHPSPRGPLLFHVGATFGQQAFLGYHRASHTGVVALATRRGRTCRMTGTAYDLLYALAGEAPD
ncbi:class A beta-lactamase-related serine hydrolase [Streptomyces sp. TM32]|uniref:serine hydrolase domain-containing protein n=1 Tax=Streptomyces sp. TM32 TaxID=1652669 RepID=UPI001013A703|nr:serine hydrolase domain-containing protein [Streptomyces sp. TM32]RXS83942.1 class A beta-lactamase-related serine hydrolase [Streptomyces sp. TM32]